MFCLKKKFKASILKYYNDCKIQFWFFFNPERDIPRGLPVRERLSVLRNDDSFPARRQGYAVLERPLRQQNGRRSRKNIVRHDRTERGLILCQFLCAFKKQFLCDYFK